jgi:hypothetical protein
MANPNPPKSPTQPPPLSDLGGHLAGAVALIQQSAQAAKEIQVHVLEAKDARGEPVRIPVAFLPDSSGGFTVASMGEAALQGARAAHELYLLDAPGPLRREGTAAHQALGSFVDHANRFKADNSTIWADPARRQLVSIPIFQDSAPQTLEVRLRVTVEEQRARFQLRIQAGAEVLADAFEHLAEYAAAETKLPLFIGTPEA